MNSFKTRAEANMHFMQMKKGIARVMVSGETGDILQSRGDQNEKD